MTSILNKSVNLNLGVSLGVSLGLAIASGCGDNTEMPCDLEVPGQICTIAGNGQNGYGGDEGLALDALMSLPQDTLTASDGMLYILDWNNHRIRSVTDDGMIHHVAGRGELGGTLDDPANSDFNHPTSLIFDETETTLIVAAWHNSKIRTVDLLANPPTIADACGDGRRAYFGDGGPAETATLDLPASIATSPAGDLVVMDQANQVLRVISADGVINHLAGRCVVDAPPPSGPGPCATPVACPAPSGKMTCGDPMTTCGNPCTPGYAGDGGPAVDMRMAQPFGQSADPAGRIVYDAEGSLYFADTANSLIRKIDTAGIVHRVAGTAPIDGVSQHGYSGDGGPALSAQLNNPVDLAFGADGTLYVTDTYNHCVRAIAPEGTITTVAGTCGQAGTGGDHGPAIAAQLKRPYGLEVVGRTLIISDTGNNRIRRVLLDR